MKHNIREGNNMIIALLIITLIMTMVSLYTGGAEQVFAASSYGEQPYAGTSNNGDNGLTMLDEGSLSTAMNITVLQEAADDETGYDPSTKIYLNEINGTIDISKKDMVTFTFAMSAGMNNFDENGFLNASPSTGLAANIDNIEVYTKDMQTLVAKYDAGYGDLVYVGAIKSGSSDLNPHGNVKTKAIQIGINKSALRNGQYILQFGKNLRGNNASKILNYNIRFLFTVKTTPVLSEMIPEAENFLSGVTAGTQSGMYPQESIDTLNEAIEAAKDAELSINENTSLTDDEKETDSNKAAGTLYDALETFKTSRILDIKVGTINGIESAQQVGDTGTTTASITCTNITGDDLEQYKDIEWSSSDNCVQINAVTGKWTAVYAGTTTITAKSVSQPERTSTLKVTVKNPDGYTAVCKDSKSTSIKQMITRMSIDPADVTNLKVFTLSGITLDTSDGNADLEYVKTYMTGLKTLDLQNADVEDNKLPTAVFEGCSSLETVMLPEQLSYISIGAFHNCTSLKKIDIPASVSSVQGGAFDGCSSLNSNMYIYSALPPTYTKNSPSYGDAFTGLDDFETPVTTIYVPAGCKEDYQQASGWNNFRIREIDPVSLTVNFKQTKGLEAAAEAACEAAGVEQGQVTNLTVTSPSGVEMNKTYDIAYLKTHFLGAQYIDLSGTHFDGENIQSSVFENRKNVKQYIFSDAITHFGKKAFAGNSNLRSFTVPEGVGYREGTSSSSGIGESCFADCPKLETLIMNCEPPGYDGSFPTSIKKIYVLSTLIDTYKADEIYSAMEDKIYPQVDLDVDDTTTAEVFSSVKLGSTVTWNPDPDNTDALTGKVTWEILAKDNTGDNDTSVAAVSSDGTVTGAKYGSVVVRATYDKGGYNECSDTCTVTISRPAPVNVTAAQNTTNSNTITWTAMKNAEGYQILRAGSENGNYEVLQTVTADTLSYVDQSAVSGTTYWYKVCGYKTVNGDVLYGDYSESKQVTTLTQSGSGGEQGGDDTGDDKDINEYNEFTDLDRYTPKDAIADAAEVNSGLLAQIERSGISTEASTAAKTMTVKFTAVDNALNYRVYYRQAGSDKWMSAWTGNNVTEYTISNMKNKGYYQFKIAAFAKNSGIWVKSEDSVTSYRYFGNLTKVKAKAGKKKVKVSWKKQSGVTGYQILYTTDKTFSEGVKVKTVKGAKKKNATVKKLKKGKTYYFKVRTYVKKSGNQYTGILSGVKKAKVK